MPEERNDDSVGKEELSPYAVEGDDPYKVLAYNLIVDYDLPAVRRMLHDNKYIKRVIIREIRGQDYKGAFVDCLFVSIMESKKRMELMHQFDALGVFFYRNLELPRLRQEIRSAFERLGASDLLE